MFQFSYFDVETPSLYQDSICQIAVISEAGDEPVIMEYLIDPEDDFHPRNVAIHGITKRDVLGQPTFPAVWPLIGDYFRDRIVVGHNVRFDLSVLYKNLYHYGFEPFDIYYIDTMDLIRSKKLECGRGLKESCRYFNIELDHHHDALADTRAACDLFKVLTKDVPDLFPYIRKYTPGDRCYGYNRALFRNRPDFSRKPPALRISAATQKILEMKDLLSSILADQEISYFELFKLRSWLTANDSLKGNFPFDVISSATAKTLEDGIITEEEHQQLFRIMDQFLNPGTRAEAETPDQLELAGKAVCLTGDFYYGSKSDVTELIERMGASVTKTVTKATNIVIIGSLGSPAWSYGTFGSKVKKAMELKDKGQAIQILREDDLKMSDWQQHLT